MTDSSEDFDLIGNLKNDEEKCPHAFQLDGLIAQDIMWLDQYLRDKYISVFKAVSPLMGNSEFYLSLEGSSSKEDRWKLLMDVHKTRAPQGTLFYFDIDDDDAEVDNTIDPNDEWCPEGSPELLVH